MVTRQPLDQLGLGTGTKARLHRILYRHGLGNGTALFLPYDQGLEHGPRDFFANPAAADRQAPPTVHSGLLRVMLVVVALVSLRHQAFPAWLGWLAVAAAAAQPAQRRDQFDATAAPGALGRTPVPANPGRRSRDNGRSSSARERAHLAILYMTRSPSPLLLA